MKQRVMRRITMSELQVPDFKNVYEFDRWVYKLEDKEIQSWTTKDWLKMYEKLDKLQALRTYPEKESLKDALIKLYRNYRLNEDDFKRMQEIGRKIGHNLAQQKMDFDLAAVNVKNDYIEGAREQLAKAADKAVYETSQYTKSTDTPLNDYQKAGSKINIFKGSENPLLYGGASPFDEYSSRIRISDAVISDDFGVTPIHESIHAQLQSTRIEQQRVLAELGLKPEEGLSDDFYKLLQYNDKYYIRGADTESSGIYDDLSRKLENGEITENEFHRLKAKTVFKGYAKQPLETHAEIIGSVAEHYYRQETGQLSERAARTFTNFVGQPQFSLYNEKGEINLTYKVKDKKTIDIFSDFIDKETRAKISTVYDEKRGTYTLTMPSDYKSKMALDRAVTASKFSICYGGIPNSIDYSQPDKILLHFNEGDADVIKNIFEHNSYGKFSEDVLRNIEIKPLADGGYTISIPKDEKSADKIISEMADIKKKVENWQEALNKANIAYQTGQPVSLACDVIPENTDLSGAKSIELDVKEIRNGVKLPEQVIVKNLNEGLDLSSANVVAVEGKTAKNIKWPNFVLVNGSVDDFTDFSSAKGVVFNNVTSVGENIKMPDYVEVRGRHYKMDLSKARAVVFNETQPRPEDILPSEITIKNSEIYELPKAKVTYIGKCNFYGEYNKVMDLANSDLSQLEQVELCNCVITDETKLPSPDKIKITGTIEVKDRANLEKLLKSDVSGLSYIETHSKEMMEGLEYPQNVVIGFEAEKTIYTPNEEALVKFKNYMGMDEVPEGIKIIRSENISPKIAEKSIVQTTKKNATKLEERLSLRSSSPESPQILNHRFPSVADMKGMEKIDLYHGSRNFFEKYDLTKARIVGGAQYGLGQYFTTKESMAYSYATLIKENPFIEKNVETNGEKVATQKVVYHGEIKGEYLSHILVPEKMSDLDYDVLIRKATEQGKTEIAQELGKIKAVAKNREIDLCQWLRKAENVEFMQSAGINGIYSTERDIYAIYDTSKMNIKVKEAVVLNGIDIPKSLVADKSIIHIQEELVDKAEDIRILTTEGKALQKAGNQGGKTITATIEKSAEKQAEHAAMETAEKAVTKSAMKVTAAKAGAKMAKTAKSVGNAALKLNAKYDALFDKNVKILMEMDAPQWMKSIDNAMAKPLNMTAEQLQKAADAFMKTESGKKIAQKVAASYAKVGGKAMAASVAKKIPLACVGIACAMAKERYEKGEYVKAGLEVVSGVAACVPVFGTAVSLGIDAAVLLSDLQVFEHGAMRGDPNSHVAAESTFVEKPIIANQEKLVKKVDKKAEAKKKAEEEKKKAESKKKAQEFEKNLYKYGGKQADFFDK